MAQCTVYGNKNPRSNNRIPYLLDVQTDLLTSLETRVVVPLYPAASVGDKILKNLTPILTIDGQTYVMMTPQLAGISKKDLGYAIADISDQRGLILAALDFLITGI